MECDGIHSKQCQVWDCAEWCFCGYRHGKFKPHYPMPALRYEVWRDEAETYGIDIVCNGALVWSSSC